MISPTITNKVYLEKNYRSVAVLFSDMVGYTQLMANDELQAWEVLKRSVSIHKTIIDLYEGILIKELGDGILACFPTTTKAIQCAEALLRKVKEEGIQLRIGIHSGNVIFDGRDIYGHVVNVAARIQAAAKKGEIWISKTVFQQIQSITHLSWRHVGKKCLKNIKQPVCLYRANINSSPNSSISTPIYNPVQYILRIAAGIFL